MMRRIVAGTVCLLWAMGGVLLAQDKAKDASLDKIKTLRSSLQEKLPVLNDLFDNQRNGIIATANAILKKFQDNNDALNKKLEAEAAKPADQQDKILMDAFRAKQARCLAMWTERTQNFVPAWSAKMAPLIGAHHHLGILVIGNIEVDQAWSKGECNPAVWISVLTELNKRVDEVKDQAAALVAEYVKRAEDDAKVIQQE